MADLGHILTRSDLLPPGCEVTPAGRKDYAFLAPGMNAPVRVTTDPGFYEQHADSVELWSPGSSLFPDMSEEGTDEKADQKNFLSVLGYTEN